MDLSDYILDESSDEENGSEKMEKVDTEFLAFKKEIENARLADKLEFSEKIKKINSQLLEQNAIFTRTIKLLEEKLAKLEEENSALKEENAGLKEVGQKNEIVEKDKACNDLEKNDEIKEKMKMCRFLPPELLCEIHKCLPIEEQIELIKNVPSRVIVLNNGKRIRQTLKYMREVHGIMNEKGREWEEEEVVLDTSKIGLGFSIRGGRDRKPDLLYNDKYIRVTEIFPRGAVAMDGRIKVDDIIVRVSERDTANCEHNYAVQAIKCAGTSVRLLVKRLKPIKAPAAGMHDR